jgi:hypothetical protein
MSASDQISIVFIKTIDKKPNIEKSTTSPDKKGEGLLELRDWPGGGCHYVLISSS